MAMRDQIYDAIMKGGATRESLLKLTGTTEKGLASQFTYLRMLGKCPMKQDDGTFKIVSAEEWAAHKTTRTPTKILSPKDRVMKAEKRVQRATTAFDNAKKKAESTPDDKLSELKYQKADAELQIAEIELGIAEEAYRDAPPEDELPDEITEETEQTEPADLAEAKKSPEDVDPGDDELKELEDELEGELE